jgi:ribosome-binding protein aMBF1 (putative translation factor)
MSRKITTAEAWTAARVRAGLSRQELATKANVAVRTIRGIESGEISRPRMTTARAGAAAREISPPDPLPEEVAA